MVKLETAVGELLAHAMRGSTEPVVDGAVALLDEELSPDEIVSSVLAGMQREVGLLWERGVISAAQEHAVTAVVDSALAALSFVVPPPAATMGRLAVVCVPDEWHVLAARMAALRWRWRGWDVQFLGGSVPAPDLQPWLRQARPDVLACSCSMSRRLPGLLQIAEAAAGSDVEVVAGGAGTGDVGSACRNIGLRWAADVDQLADALNGTPAQPAPHMAQHRMEADDLLADASDLCLEVLRSLPTLMDASSMKSAEARRTLVAEVQALLEALISAVLVDEPQVFEDFLAWQRRVLTAREAGIGLHLEICRALPGVLIDYELARAVVLAAARTDDIEEPL